MTTRKKKLKIAEKGDTIATRGGSAVSPSKDDAHLLGGNPGLPSKRGQIFAGVPAKGSLQPSFSEKQIRQWLDDWYDGYEGKQFSRMYNKKVKRITATYSPLAVFSIAKSIASRAAQRQKELDEREMRR